MPALRGLKRRLDRRRSLFEYKVLASAVYVIVDIIAIVAAGFLAYYARFLTLAMPGFYQTVLGIAVLVGMVIFPQFRLYTDWEDKTRLAKIESIVGSWGCVLLVLVVLGFVFQASASYSRLWFGLWMLLGVAALSVGRALAGRIIRSLRNNENVVCRVVIVGQGAVAERAVRQIQASRSGHYRVCRVIPQDEATLNRAQELSAIPTLSNRVSLAGFIERAAIDEVWFCLSLRDEQVLVDFQEYLKYTTVTQRLIPDIDTYRMRRHDVTEVAGLTALNLNLSPMQGINRILKAIEDRVLSALILVLISPLVGLIALAIKLDSPGPVLFVQKRHGWNCEEINVLKFRSMYAGDDTGGVAQATLNDARVTRVGRLIRSTSLDELPQFWNVLRGDMSIVGPRPLALEHNISYREHIDAYMQRHGVKPGITGWAQVYGLRGQTDTTDKMRQRIEYDLYYIEHWSLWLDFKIIVMTVFRGFLNPNAY